MGSVLALLVSVSVSGAHAQDDENSYYGAACDVDSDCAEYHVCEAVKREMCPEGWSPPGGCAPDESDEDCAARESEVFGECSVWEESVCLPNWHWEFDCESDERCGEGFVCGGGFCQPADPNCEVDEDCPDVWTCFHPGNGDDARCILPEDFAAIPTVSDGEADADGPLDEAGDPADGEGHGGCTVGSKMAGDGWGAGWVFTSALLLFVRRSLWA